jgi:hypothetical protein
MPHIFLIYYVVSSHIDIPLIVSISIRVTCMYENKESVR